MQSSLPSPRSWRARLSLSSRPPQSYPQTCSASLCYPSVNGELNICSWGDFFITITLQMHVVWTHTDFKFSQIVNVKANEIWSLENFPLQCVYMYFNLRYVYELTIVCIHTFSAPGALRVDTVDVCENIVFPSTADYHVTVSAAPEACRILGNQSISAQIQFIGFGNVDIDISLACDCGCTDPVCHDYYV